MKNKKTFAMSSILMVVLGASDAMRGIFSPLFIESFGFTVEQIGIIMAVSYLGNLVCLLFGGAILDKIGFKKAFLLFLFALAFSELLLILGRNYAFILIGFFLTLGISTLLSTSINIISNEFSNTNALMFLNILFFIQGIGTTLSQLLLSNFSSSIYAWNIALICFSALLSLIALSFARTDFISSKTNEKEIMTTNKMQCKSNTKLFALTISLAFYLIAEHGVTNYIMMYGHEYLKLEKEYVGTALASFSFGIMAGRLIIAPVIHKIGKWRVLLLLMTLNVISLAAVFVFDILNLVFLSGLSCSIVYPTLVNLAKDFVSASMEARATTTVVSIASAFDISFNFIFGFAITKIGYKIAIELIPLSATISLLFLIWTKLMASGKSIPDKC